MINKKNLTILGIIALLMGLQYWATPTKTKIKYIEVEKIVEVIDRDIVIVEKSNGEKVTKIKERVNKEIDKQIKQVKQIDKIKKDWLVSVSKSLNGEVYSGSISRRVIFDLYVGVYATTNKEYGLSLSYSF